jgi:hypothetical protein
VREEIETVHLKTSRLVAAGVLAIAGTPLALHLIGGSSNGGTRNWIKTLHGGGSPAAHGSPATAHVPASGSSEISSTSGIQAPAEKSTPASLSDLAGKWTVTLENPQGNLECRMVLKQDGKKLTGTFSNPHGEGEFPAAGEFVGGALTLSVDGKTDHGDIHLEFKGAIKKDDGSLAGVMTSAMGESKFSARRTR